MKPKTATNNDNSGALSVIGFAKSYFSKTCPNGSAIACASCFVIFHIPISGRVAIIPVVVINSFSIGSVSIDCFFVLRFRVRFGLASSIAPSLDTDNLTGSFCVIPASFLSAISLSYFSCCSFNFSSFKLAMRRSFSFSDSVLVLLGLPVLVVLVLLVLASVELEL